MTIMERAAESVQFDTDGYFLHPKPVFDANLIRRASEGMDLVRHGQSDTGRAPIDTKELSDSQLCKLEMPQISSLGVRELVSSPALGALAAKITGASMVQVWWVQLLHKPSSDAPSDRTVIGWHRDRTYWGNWEGGSELFTARVALTDVAADCGPMIFVRGSHRWPIESGGDFWSQDLEAQKASLSPPAGAAWEEAPALLRAGGVSFHDDLTLHGSSHNLSGLPRRSFAIHMRTQDSAPKDGKREGLTAYIDDHAACPVIYGRWP